MPIYKVYYASMIATYGPDYIEAGSENEARRKFGINFTSLERSLIHVEEVSIKEIRDALMKRKEDL